MKIRDANEIEGVHKFVGTLTFEFYGQPGFSTTDVFRYELGERFKEDPMAMLEDMEWKSEPISIVTWSERVDNGKLSEDGEPEERIET